MELMKGNCPECGEELHSHRFEALRITKKIIYVKLERYDRVCEFIGMIIS